MKKCTNIGSNGVTIGMKSFGASAPLKDLQKKFNFAYAAWASSMVESVRTYVFEP